MFGRKKKVDIHIGDEVISSNATEVVSVKILEKDERVAIEMPETMSEKHRERFMDELHMFQEGRKRFLVFATPFCLTVLEKAPEDEIHKFPYHCYHCGFKGKTSMQSQWCPECGKNNNITPEQYAAMAKEQKEIRKSEHKKNKTINHDCIHSDMENWPCQFSEKDEEEGPFCLIDCKHVLPEEVAIAEMESEALGQPSAKEFYPMPVPEDDKFIYACIHCDFRGTVKISNPTCPLCKKNNNMPIEISEIKQSVPAIYECGHCGHKGPGQQAATGEGLSAPWCSKCGKNDKLVRQ